MSSYLEKIMSDDFVWSAINSHITNRKMNSNHNININCPMCVSRGETPDTRKRCGIKRFPDSIVINCFNCKFKTKFIMGDLISKSMKGFLSGIGLSEMEVLQLNHKAFSYSKLIGSADKTTQESLIFSPNFTDMPLPKGSRRLYDMLNDDDIPQDAIDVLCYLDSRGEVLTQYQDFYWSPAYKRRLILPFRYQNKIVGWTGRTIDKSDSKTTKYYTEKHNNFLFNNHLLYQPNRKYIILVEGPFDAISIDGISPLGSTISQAQAQWINSSGKEIIVLGDRDSAGKKMIDFALQYNWAVSFPRLKEGRGLNNWWDTNISDAADAAKEYGKLYTLKSILDTATTNKLEINVKRKLI